MRTWVRDHGLLLANLALFVDLLRRHGPRRRPGLQRRAGSSTAGCAVSLLGYLTTGDFVEATFENWESEFLQMGMYVVLTAFLFQRGSSESKPIDEPAPQDEDPREAARRSERAVAGPARRLGAHRSTRTRCRSCSSRCSSARSLLHAARRRPGLQRRAAGPRRAAVTTAGVPRHVAVLVRVVPELAERVPGRRRHRRRVGLPAAARLAGVEAGRRAARQDGCVTLAIEHAPTGAECRHEH